MVSDVVLDSPVGKSDHSVISFNFNAYIEDKSVEKLRYKYDKGDYQRMSEMLDVDWEEKLQASADNVDEQWNVFSSILNQAIEECIPSKLVKVSGWNKKKQTVPLDKKTLSKIKRKQRLWSRFLSTQDGSVYTEYCRIRNQVRTLTRKLTKAYEKNVVSQVKSNPKKFWNYTRTKTKTRGSIPDLYKNPSKDTTSGDKEKADVLAEFFSSVFTNEPEANLPDLNPKTDKVLNHIIITPELVEKKLKNLNISKSPGPDNFHPRVLKELCSVLSVPLSIIFNSSITSGSLPEEWKQAAVTALFKKGDRKVAGNYRPVNLTCIICKVLESLVRENIVGHMKDNKLFSQRQFGFISGRSTVLQLIQVLDRWAEILDVGGCVDVVYCDFMKAFDKVPHLRLLHKLGMYGIQDPYTSWIRSFLLGRKQKVIVNGQSSEWREVTSGIPQGSVLGPILFVLYINDLPDVTSQGTHAYLFADDTKVFRSVMDPNDCNILQEDLHQMQSWTDKWLLCFHPDKCKVMRIGNSSIAKKDYTLKQNGNTLQYSEFEKDIGVIIDDKLTFDKHISEKVNKANSIMGLIRRTMEYMDCNSFKILFTALVRPHLEYANQVWCPHLVKHIDSIENVQRRATKLIPGMRDLTYSERLRKLGLPTLAYRRARGDMIELYKILTGKYDPEVSDFIKPNESASTRGHMYKLFKTRTRLNTRKYSFIHRSVDLWNSLPLSVVTAKTVVSFESRLDRHWRDQPILYNYRERVRLGQPGSDQSPTMNEEDSLELTGEDSAES